MSVTVVIPTHKRAQYLVTVLESVRRQTARNKIDQIIVSENSDDNSSQSVCEQFADLKITYIQQNPQISALEHLSWIIDQSSSQYTAMLHDDDWWYPTHLETALANLDNNNAIAYFSNFILAENEIGKAAFFHYPSVMSYFLGDRGAFEPITLTFREVATMCYLFTPFHMSGMVSETSSLRKANEDGLRNGKPWYADRIIYPYLGLYGNIAYNSQVLCGIRMHPKNDGNSIIEQDRINHHREGSEKIANLALSQSISVIEEWSRIKSKVTEAEWEEVRNIYKFYLGESQNSIFSFEDKSPPSQSNVKRLVKNILPYGLVHNYGKFFNWNKTN